MKTTIVQIFTIMVLSMAAASCLKTIEPGKTGEAVKLSVKVVLPDDMKELVNISDVTVKMQNKNLPVCYNAHPDANGNVIFNVAADKYDILVSYYNKATRISANGMHKEFLLTDAGIASSSGEFEKPEFTIDLAVSLPSPIVIREFFYHGSKTLEGDEGYTKDQYFEIFNNNGKGGNDYYLDSLCIAAIYPYNSTGGNNAWSGADTLAIAQMYWMIPGDGHSYCLKPGEGAVVAAKSAMDHSSRATSGLQLNKAQFCCYDENLSGHEISAGVVPLVLTMAGMGTAWALSIHSPALVLFRPSMGVAEYRRQAHIWERYEPGKTTGTKYWHIAKEWIIDGIECYDSPTGALKRLPASIDASYACMTAAHYSGLCISRKMDEDASTEDIKVYKDTNNSLEDFNVDVKPSPSLKQ